MSARKEIEEGAGPGTSGSTARSAPPTLEKQCAACAQPFDGNFIGAECMGCQIDRYREEPRIRFPFRNYTP